LKKNKVLVLKIADKVCAVLAGTTQQIAASSQQKTEEQTADSG
jgi:hypothetical protein